MKNEAFKKATDAVETFQKAYQEKLATAEHQLEQLQEKKAQAEIRAAEAVSADDQAAWKKADRERVDADAGIKYTQERLAMIRSGADLPLEDFNRLRDQIEAEQGLAVLAYVGALQEHYRKVKAAQEALERVFAESREALGELYAAGGSEEAGYIRIPNYQPNWGYLLQHGHLLNDELLEIDLAEGVGNMADPVPRAVKASIEAIRRAEGKK